jgi:hypothetical protein
MNFGGVDSKTHQAYGAWTGGHSSLQKARAETRHECEYQDPARPVVCRDIKCVSEEADDKYWNRPEVLSKLPANNSSVKYK